MKELKKKLFGEKEWKKKNFFSTIKLSVKKIRYCHNKFPYQNFVVFVSGRRNLQLLFEKKIVILNSRFHKCDCNCLKHSRLAMQAKSVSSNKIITVLLIGENIILVFIKTFGNNKFTAITIKLKPYFRSQMVSFLHKRSLL